MNCKGQCYTSVRTCVVVRSINVRMDMEITEGCKLPADDCAETLPATTFSVVELDNAELSCEVAVLDAGTELLFWNTRVILTATDPLEKELIKERRKVEP